MRSDLCCFVSVRCLINCEKIASISTRISLTTTCTGHACKAAKYLWQLVSVHADGNEIKETLTRDMTQTDLNLPGIIIKENELSEGLVYLLKVTVTQDNGPAGMAAYDFTMNTPPHSGQCTVTPETGDALKTRFDFECTGWQVRIVIPSWAIKFVNSYSVRTAYTFFKVIPEPRYWGAEMLWW